MRSVTTSYQYPTTSQTPLPAPNSNACTYGCGALCETAASGPTSKRPGALYWRCSARCQPTKSFQGYVEGGAPGNEAHRQGGSMQQQQPPQKRARVDTEVSPEVIQSLNAIQAQLTDLHAKLDAALQQQHRDGE